MKHNQRIGKWGEETAVGFLVQKGCEIVGQNVRTPYGEIDIVAKRGNTIIFVEVKTRTSNKMGLPEESITARKREHMIACAEHYAMEREIDGWQIDVISIEGKPGGEPVITHFENAI
ncbi:MAG: YraN family protein [Anaerolineales bacterium]|nr:YraN family protein [Anaerolineales bacterium]NUQ86569.1 YraN family protein [Anaerolineales bacterium]